MRKFTYHNPGKMLFGEGAIKRTAKEAAALGGSRALLITDEALAESPMVEAVKAALGDLLAATFSGVIPDTGLEVIEEAARLGFEKEVDLVVSVGGGSSIDTAKSAAAMLGAGPEGGSIRDMVGYGKLPRAPLPHIAIPTTAGTGSECTSMALVKDRQKHEKLLVMDPRLIPAVAILDPALTVSLPKGLTASTGMDAMTHAAEAIMSRNAIPPTDALAVHAISVIAEYLPRAVDKGDDLEARSMTLIAAAEAGQAFTNAYVGVVHAMAHALGGIAGVPHGLANGILLPAGMEYNALAVPERVALIGKAMGMELSGDPKKDAMSAAKAMREFARSVGIPDRLKHAGVEPSCLADAAILAMADSSMLSNPRKPEEPGEIEELLKNCL